ncbi:MAG: fibronectin type III-like domain-contianing protein, partial [Bacteroidales bacterium]
HHLDDGFEPLYPFGFGLSYTTFEYSDLKLSSSSISKDGAITITATITNTGKLEGFETVQLYVHDVVGSITRPVKELKAFQKVKIKPGESVEVTFILNANDLAYYIDWNNRVIEPGLFTVWVGPNSNSGLKNQFELK